MKYGGWNMQLNNNLIQLNANFSLIRLLFNGEIMLITATKSTQLSTIPTVPGKFILIPSNKLV